MAVSTPTRKCICYLFYCALRKLY